VKAFVLSSEPLQLVVDFVVTVVIIVLLYDKDTFLSGFIVTLLGFCIRLIALYST